MMSSEELHAADPSSIAEALNQLPEFQNSPRPQTTGIGTVGNAGQSFLNLRSIGAERTLILLDGRRVVPSTSNGTVDISILPEALVQNVDVVTGGASAAYGSDAVAGVVNFILDTDFTGVEIEAQYGVAEIGQAQNVRTSISAGTDLANGRGHAMGSVSYYTNDGIEGYEDFDWFQSCSRIVNPAGPPDNLLACGVVSAHFSRGGAITTGPLSGTQFGPGGTPEPFVFGTLRSQQSMVGGSGEDFGEFYQPLPSADRINAFGRVSYDVTPTATVYLEGLAAEAKAGYEATATWQGFGTAYTIYRNNAFLPAQTAAAMDRAGIGSFSMARYNLDFDPLTVASRNRTWRVVAGLDAEFGLWSFNAYYEHGENKYRQTVENNLRLNRLYEAADAIRHPVTGEIICNSALIYPERGCAPLNLFGNGSPSRAALDYVQGTTQQDTHVKQDVIEASVNGEPFETWAGPVGVAFGAGYRKESYVQTSDPVSQEVRRNTGGYRGFPASYSNEVNFGQIGGWERTNPLPARGDYDVKEVFGEVVVPLASGLAFADSLELNGAVRLTDYSTSGSVTTWKAGATYQPIPEVLFRASQSRDIRAANLEEMFRGGTQGLQTVTDPAFPAGDPRNRPFVNGRNFGNPNLTPEEADTTTLGVVYQPLWAPGLSLAVDYYRIDLQNTIGVLGVQQMIDQCVIEGADFFCPYLIRDAAGVLTLVERPSLNIGEVETSGWDFEVRYVTSADAFVDSWRGDLTFRLIANTINKLLTKTPGAAALDTAGQIGGAGVPDLSINFSTTYQLDNLRLFMQHRFIAGGPIDRTLTTRQLAPQDNYVEDVFYTDVTAGYTFDVNGRELEVYGTVNNLFDTDPPRAPGAFFFFGTSPTSSSHYDIIGRRYTIGLKAAF
jgi:outer membrane receptor protein involved in Fe transport